MYYKDLEGLRKLGWSEVCKFIDEVAKQKGSRLSKNTIRAYVADLYYVVREGEEVFKLFVNKGKRFKEVARELGINERVGRIRTALRLIGAIQWESPTKLKWSKEVVDGILKALRKYVPSSKVMKGLGRRGRGFVNAVQRYYGSWSKALEQHGLAQRVHLPQTHSSQFHSPEVFRECLKNYVREQVEHGKGKIVTLYSKKFYKELEKSKLQEIKPNPCKVSTYFRRTIRGVLEELSYEYQIVRKARSYEYHIMRDHKLYSTN